MGIIYSICYFVLFLHYFWLVFLCSTPKRQSYVIVPSQSRSSPVPVPSQNDKSVPRMWNREERTLCALQNTLEAISHGTMQSYVGQTSLMCDRPVLFGQTSLRWEEQSNMGHSNFMWYRTVSYGTGQSPMGQSSSKGFSEAQKEIKRPIKSSNKRQKESKGLKNESKWV